MYTKHYGLGIPNTPYRIFHISYFHFSTLESRVTTTSPRLPHLRSHRYQSIKQLFSERDSRKVFLVPFVVNDEDPVCDFAVRGPAYDEFGFPA